MREKLSDMDTLLQKPQYSPDVFIEEKKKKRKLEKRPRRIVRIITVFNIIKYSHVHIDMTIGA